MPRRPWLEEEVSTVLGALSSDDAGARLEKAGIANARMRTVGDFLEHPQLAARGRWRDVGSPAGPLRALLPPGIPEDAEPVMAPIPSVGEHTKAILEELGYDEEAVNALRRQAAV